MRQQTFHSFADLRDHLMRTSPAFAAEAAAWAAEEEVRRERRAFEEAPPSKEALARMIAAELRRRLRAR